MGCGVEVEFVVSVVVVFLVVMGVGKEVVCELFDDIFE